jgi:hypothetical protein
MSCLTEPNSIAVVVCGVRSGWKAFSAGWSTVSPVVGQWVLGCAIVVGTALLWYVIWAWAEGVHHDQ